MQFKKWQRVQWSYGEPTYQGIIVTRSLRRGFVEVLVTHASGKALAKPYPVCMYPSETDLRPVEDHNNA